MLLQHKKVAIIGAGPVGLTMAVLLQQRGVDVTVYERDKNPNTRIWGGTLDLHKGSGQDALQQAGLLDAYYALARPMGRTVVDNQGNVLFTKKPDYDNPEINRNDLRTLLLNSLTNDTVVWDRHCTGLDEHNGTWHLAFSRQSNASADVVIGANGGLSSVRQYVTDAAIEPTGTYIIQGEVPQPETQCPAFYQLCQNSILMCASEGHLLVANPQNNNALTYNVTFRQPADWFRQNGLDFQDTGTVATFLADRFAHWDDCYRQLFRATSFFTGLPTRQLPVNKPWKMNRPLPITLIGDAAHVMPPFAGQGVNSGLMDALILAENLTNGTCETIQAAIDAYEQTMVGYAAEAQRDTSRNELAMHQPDFSFATLFRSQGG